MKNGKSTPRQQSVALSLRTPFAVSVLVSVISLVVLLFVVGNPAPDLALQKKKKKGQGIPGSMKAMDLWSEMRTYPAKELNGTTFAKSFDQARMMSLAHTAPNARVNTDPWTELGPMNFAGRILSIGFHPTDPNIMWVGSASGGLWKTTCGGTGGPGGISWTHVSTGFPVLGISSIVVNPDNPDEIYIGTGEVYNAGALGTGSTGAGHYRLFRGSYGIGILKTTDGGATWTKSLDFAANSIKGVMDMLIHPTNPATVFAATTDGIYRTTNSGASWTLIHNVPMVMDMVFKPGNPNVIYAGCGNFQSPNNGIWKTTNANAATPSWTKLNSGTFPSPISGKIMLAISADNPSRIYASIGRDPDEPGHSQGLYVSANEGDTWAKMSTNILGNQGWYGHDIAVSQANDQVVIWGELDMYRSDNGGTNFDKTGSWNLWDVNNTTVGDLTEGLSNTTGYVHADVHRIEPSPHNNNTFFALTDGGVFRSTNGGLNWNTLNGGLNTAQIYGNMAQHPTNPNYMLLGLQDNEASVYEGSPGQRRIGNLGDGFHATMSSNGRYQIVESYYFNIRRSTNYGSSFSNGSGAVPTSEVACFNVPVTFSRTPNSSYVFAGTVKFKRSTDNGSYTTSPKSTSFTNLNGNAPIAGANNPCIAMVAPNNNTVYFSTAPRNGIRSKLWKTTNATAAAASVSFTEITGALPDRYYSDIDVDPSNPNRVFVTLSGFGSPHLYMSLDGGANWTNIGNGLPDVPANAVFVNPNNPQQIYIGNDLGVFFANNVPTSGPIGATYDLTWNAYNEGLGDAMMVSDIQITNTGMLRMASYGRGLWEREEAPYVMLPVQFTDFQVRVTQQGNLCRWVVSDQLNVDRYEVEYSRDGTNFSKVASVPAKNSGGEISYEFLHRIYNDVDGFYRIKSVDLDGAYDYSVIRIVRADRKIGSMTAYPNPSNGEFQLRIPMQRQGLARVQIFSIDGRLVEDMKLALQQGTNLVPVNISTHANGTYRVVCILNETTHKLNIIKK